MIYLLVFLFEAVICYFYDKMQMNDLNTLSISNYKLRISFRKFFMVTVILLPIWLVIGLRYNIGTDYRSYEIIFRDIALYKRNMYNMEPGYYYLNRIAAKITQNPQIIFFLTAFLIVFFFFKGIEKSNGSMYYGVLAFMGMGYYFYAMNLQRQYIAIMIMFYALRFLEKKQIWQYLICVIAAALFHVSAIIWIPVYFAVNYIPTKSFYWGSLGIAILVNRLGNYVLNILANVGFYTGQIRRNKSFFSSRLSWTNVVVSGAFLLCGIVFHKQFKEKKQENSIRFKLVWLTFLIYLFLYQFGAAATRIAVYMCVAYFVLIPEIIYCFNMGSRKWIRIIVSVVLLVLMYMVVTYSGNESQSFLPYQYRMLWD